VRIMATLIDYPLLALVVGGAFVGAWLWRRVRSAAIAGLLWFIYSGYEYLIFVRFLCSGDCSIRVDLLVIYPLLLVVSFVALWNTVRGGTTPAQRADSSA
jgi:hypothetical protein